MRPSLPSALWIVAGIGTIAASIALLIGIVVEWGIIGGALRGGESFGLWLAIEVALVVAIAALLIGTTRQADRR